MIPTDIEARASRGATLLDNAECRMGEAEEYFRRLTAAWMSEIENRV